MRRSYFQNTGVGLRLSDLGEVRYGNGRTSGKT